MKIPIFFASDDNYAPYLSTAMLSVLQNTKSEIDFYVLDGGIKSKNKRKIASLHNSIEFIDMEKFNLKRFPDIAHYSTNAFSRYFIPELKPDLGRILYLDVDIIVKSDVAELFNQDLENYPLGAVLEDFFPKNSIHLKKIYPAWSSGTRYFNSGILVMELDYFRKNNISQKLIDKTLELQSRLNCPDQDILNIIFENNFKVLDYKFNFMPEHLNIKNPVIIHYTGTKPWKDADAIDFWQIAEISPFYKKLKHDLVLPEFLKKLPSLEHIKYLQASTRLRAVIINASLKIKCSKFRV